MKSIFLLALALSVTAAAATAQKTTPARQGTTAAPAVDPKLMFASKINELDANLSRGRAEEAKKIYGEISVMMQKAMTGEYARTNMNEKGQLYMEIKPLSLDLAGNREVLVTKLRAFQQYL